MTGSLAADHADPRADRRRPPRTRRAPVPKYITFFSYTGDAVKAMIDRPSDRTAAAKALAESVGGTLDAFYWMHGAHDGFLITHLPDGISAMALAGAAGATGAITNFETHEIFDHDDQSAIIAKGTGALQTYRPPTA
jgi:uncharacterized protein with GYD domain